jgi:putative endonuclease
LIPALDLALVKASFGSRKSKSYNLIMPLSYCYIVECSDGSFYTGWTVDVQRRVKEHNAGRGARYTRARRPVQLAYTEKLPSIRAAMHRERAIKRLSHDQKRDLIETNNKTDETQETNRGEP